MICRTNYWKLLPAVAFVWMLLTCFISFVIAVCLDHLNPVWPYISDVGAVIPERCYFGFMLSIETFLMGAVFFCRYKQVCELMVLNERLPRLLEVLNTLCLISGVAVVLGISMVANFQINAHPHLHKCGAFLIFIVGTGYFIINTVISFLLNAGSSTGNILNIVRAVLCFLQLITSFLSGFCNIIQEEKNALIAMKITSENPDYKLRLISTISEWFLAFAFGFNLFTLAYDFNFLDFELTFRDSRVDIV